MYLQYSKHESRKEYVCTKTKARLRETRIGAKYPAPFCDPQPKRGFEKRYVFSSIAVIWYSSKQTRTSFIPLLLPNYKLQIFWPFLQTSMASSLARMCSSHEMASSRYSISEVFIIPSIMHDVPTTPMVTSAQDPPPFLSTVRHYVHPPPHLPLLTRYNAQEPKMKMPHACFCSLSTTISVPSSPNCRSAAAHVYSTEESIQHKMKRGYIQMQTKLRVRATNRRRLRVIRSIDQQPGRPDIASTTSCSSRRQSRFPRQQRKSQD